MYEDVTYEMILKRMLDRVPNNMDKREGSIIWDALAPAAAELKLLYLELNDILDESFADTASREFLIRRCAERGISPDPATHALLEGKFTPSNIDILGRRFNMPNANINYRVIEKIQDGAYRVQCESTGVQGNQYLGSILPIDYIDGLQTAELTSVLIPGEDEEETEVLRQRYFSSFDAKAYGGNQKDYLEKTNSIPGVGLTKVTPFWNGGGTVKLTILNSSFDKASTTLIQTVQQVIDPTNDGMGVGIAPIGHVVTVDTVRETSINVSADVAFDEGYNWDAVKLQAMEALQAYLLELRMTWANQSNLVIRISQIETRLLSIQGILDVTHTKINSSSVNLVLDTLNIPIYGGITA